MARIAGVVLPSKKRIEIALTYIFGIGRSTAKDICEKCKIDPNKKIDALTPEEFRKIQNEVAKLQIEGDLKRKIQEDVQRLKRINCYRGVRHKKGLPVRGQRTKSNARTKRGRRRGSMATRKKKPVKA